MRSRTLPTLMIAAALMVMLGAQPARAGGSSGSCDVTCQIDSLLTDIVSYFDGGKTGGHVYGTAVHAAPAPLLAAGVPAFIALGGGAVVLRLRRRFRRGS